MAEHTSQGAQPRPIAASLMLLTSLALSPPSAAGAQASSATTEPGGDLYARAASVRPLRMTAGRTIWDTGMLSDGRETFIGPHLVTHEGTTRVEIDSLLLEGSAVGMLQWYPFGPDQIVIARAGTPEVAAAFHDTPAAGWRYELGGAVALPMPGPALTVIDGQEPSGFPALPLVNLLRQGGLGWNAYRMLAEAVTLVASARGEWDALPELVLALEVDVPVQISFEGDVAVYPQVALDIAGRFLTHQLVGLRAELTSYALGGSNVNVLLEPFARFVWSDPVTAPFLRLAIRLPLGPSIPLMGLGGTQFGYLGGSLSVGALY